jgi:ribosomal protein S18 acetylase RimI-like enzyme
LNNVIISQASVNDFEAISSLIADQNKKPDTHCIQSDTGDDYKTIQNEMLRLNKEAAICCLAAFQKSELIGALGCELDQELGRGWTRGPFVVSEPVDWEEVASSLLYELRDALPPSIHRLDSFLNIANERGNQFYLSNGFLQLRLVHVYVCKDPINLPEDFEPGESLNPLDQETFITLHNSVFPQTYASGQKIAEKLDENHRVFVNTRRGELLGYVYATIDEDTGDGSVDYIGVKSEARGKGIGRQLLFTALQWLFEIKKVKQVVLVVNDDLADARSLYENVGFRLKYTGVHTRKDW